MTDGIENGAARILIAEDEAILAEDLGLSLKNLGYVVRGKVSTGEEAVELAEKLKPDLILMDIKLQGDIDGIEAADRIHKSMDIPIVYLTGYSESDVLERAKKTEPYGYIGKPISVSELRNTIETALFRHAADKKVRESAEKYRLLFSKERDAIALTDAISQDFLDINESFEALYGYTREEIIGMSATMVSAEPENTRSTLRAATQPEGVVVPLRWHKTKSGQMFPVEISANAFTLKGRQVVCSIIRDITERKKAEQALWETGDLLRKSQEIAHVGSWQLDLTTDRLIWSDEVYHIFGMLPQEFAATYEAFLERVHPDDRAAVDEAYSGSLRDGTDAYEIEHRIVTRDSGEIRHVHEKCQHVRNFTGKIIRSVGMVQDITDRKNAEEVIRTARNQLEQLVQDRTKELVASNEALRESQSTLRLIADSLPVLISYVDSEQRYRFCNKTHELWRGVQKGEIQGRHLREVLGDEAYEEARHYVEAALSGNPVDYEMRATYQDGKVRNLRVMYVPDVDEKGATKGFAGLVADITERKKMEEAVRTSHDELEQRVMERTDEFAAVNADLTMEIAGRKNTEKALRENERKYRSLVENIPDVTWTTDSEGNTTFISPNVERIYGYTPEEIYQGGHSLLFGRIHPDDLQDVKTAAAAFYEKGERFDIEYRIQRKDGRWIWLHDRSVATYHKRGALFADGVFTDITERKKAEIELRHTTSLLNSLVEALPDIVYFKDLERRYLLTNRAQLQFTGLGREATIGRMAEEILPPDLFELSRKSDEQVMRTKEPVFVEECVADKQGEKMLLETRKFPILDDQGEIIAIGGISRDITERRRSEEQIKTSLREKEVLLREIHHRVKNNLAVIRSLLSIQSHHVKNVELSRILEETQHRIRSMALGHELLYQSENLSSINISQYLGNLLSQLVASFSIIGKRIEINKEIQDVEVGIDTAVPLGFILTELISNCYQHAFPESKHGEISVFLRFLGDENLELVVRDDGMGLPDHVDFEESNSLGYHLMKIFVRQLNGKVEIKRLKGTEVRISFPLK